MAITNWGPVTGGLTIGGRGGPKRRVLEPFHGSAWKQVDAVDAHYLERGSLKLGRLEDYQNLENGRADELDGACEIDQGQAALFWEVPEHRAALERIGFGGTAIAVGNRVSERLPPTYAFCMSLVDCAYDPSPEVPKAIFEVSDVPALAELLLSRLSDRVWEMRLGKVLYEPRELDPAGALTTGASAFIKRPQFSVEQEVRISLTARSGVPYEPIFTGDDAEIAKLFTRLQ